MDWCYSTCIGFPSYICSSLVYQYITYLYLLHFSQRQQFWRYYTSSSRKHYLRLTVRACRMTQRAHEPHRSSLLLTAVDQRSSSHRAANERNNDRPSHTTTLLSPSLCTSSTSAVSTARHTRHVEERGRACRGAPGRRRRGRGER